MRITPISNNYNINFGYNKKLNAQLRETLASYPDKVWASTLSDLNNTCNNLEDEIRRQEQDPKSDRNKMFDYVDIFTSCKEMLVSFVSVTFESLNFADREYKQYNKEFKKNGSSDDDWRKDILKVIENWTSDGPNAKVANSLPGDEIYEPIFDEDGVEITDPEKIKAAKAKVPAGSKLSPNSLLKIHIPDKDSPKGFKDVSGMEKLKQELSENIVQYYLNPKQAEIDYREYGKTMPKTIMLYGPPGCGKTYIVEALAAELNAPLYKLNISEAGSQYINETSKNIRSAFDEIKEIAQKSDKPCLLFLDELDSLALKRSDKMEADDIKQVATILLCLEDIKNSNIIVLAATNKHDLIDPAVLRRFKPKTYVDIPDKDAIKALIVKTLSPMSKAATLLDSDEELDKSASLFQGFSNKSVYEITKEAAMNALRRDRADIDYCDFEKAIKETTEEKPDLSLYQDERKRQKKRIGF